MRRRAEDIKWFKHLSDSHTNLKHRAIMHKLGLEAYAIYWICLELVAQQGKQFKINQGKDWRAALLVITNISDEERLDEILRAFADQGLICKKALSSGALYIPKMKETADEWSARVIRENENKTIMAQHNITKDKINKVLGAFMKKKGYPLLDKANCSYVFARNTKTAKSLLVLTGGDAPRVVDGIEWIADLLEKKNLNWTLETVLKWFPDYLVKGKQIDSIPASLRKYA